MQSGGDMEGPRRWRRELVEALGLGRIADRWVGYSARCMTGLCGTVKSICAKWCRDRGGGDTVDHCQADRAGDMQQSV